MEKPFAVLPIFCRFPMLFYGLCYGETTFFLEKSGIMQ